jgi:hypothetical protein
MTLRLAVAPAIAALVSLGLAAAPVEASGHRPSFATDPGVTINEIPDKSVKHGSRVTVKPSVHKEAGIRLISARLTVTQHGDTVAEGKTRVTLSPGKYKVKTVVKYQWKKEDSSWSSTKRSTQTQVLTITEKQVPRPTPTPQAEVYYRNCDAARAAGAAPVYRGDPGYARHLDRDNDGIGCE